MAILKYLLRRLLLMLLTLFVLTAFLYGLMMLIPAEARSEIYQPSGWTRRLPAEKIIREHGLNDPYPLQYARWIYGLVRGEWGWSPMLNRDVLPALLQRTPVTAELTLYSVLLFIPLGLASGVVAAWRQGRPSDFAFRAGAFVATSIPPFILGLFLLAIFYVGLGWFPPGRLSDSIGVDIRSTLSSYQTFTGLLTVDGLLNGRLDVTLDGLRHLALPVFTLSLAHWATLGRLTRVSMIEEIGQDYVLAARGRGLSLRQTLWRHALRNALLPALNTTAFSIASLLTGVFVVEVIFSLPGISAVLYSAVKGGAVAGRGSMWIPDVAALMGFAVYSVLLVLPLMLILDLVQAAIDPRVREEEQR